MRRRLLILAAMLVLMFLGLLVHGVGVGDADFVRANAESFCQRCAFG